MGAHYGSVHFRTDDRDAVLAAVGKVAKKSKARFLVGPALRGWVGVYPENNGQGDQEPKALAKLLGGDAIHLGVHDSDIFFYTVFSQGKIVDEYNSIPDYFGPVSAQKKAKLRGQPATWQYLLPSPDRLDAMKALLTSERPVFADGSLEEFVGLLELPNAMTAYEYLLEEEDENDAEGWKDFVHIPEAESNLDRQKVQNVEIDEVKDDLRTAGKLLYWESRPAKPFPYQPFWCSDGDAGLLVAWGNAAQQVQVPLLHYQPPWDAPQPVGLEVSSYVNTMAQSSSGMFLAIGQASGRWQADVYDLGAKSHCFTIPHVRTVVWVGFSVDDAFLVTLGNDDCHITDMASKQEIASITISNAKTGVIHPDGYVLIADRACKVHVVELATGEVRQSLIVGEPGQAKHDLQQQQQLMKQVLGTINVEDLIAKQMQSLDATVAMFMKFQTNRKDPNAELNAEQFRQQLIENTNKMAMELREKQQAEQSTLPTQGIEQIMAMEYCPELGLLAVGSSHGVRVYEWKSILQAQHYFPKPRWAATVESNVYDPASSNNYVYTVAFDAERNWLLYGGLAGIILVLDVATGATQTLLRLPGSASVLRISLTTDLKHLVLLTRPGLTSRTLNMQQYEMAVWDYQVICQDLSCVGLRIFNDD